VNRCANDVCANWCQGCTFGGGYTYGCPYNGLATPLTRVCEVSLESSPYATRVGSCTFNTNDPNFVNLNGTKVPVYVDLTQFPVSSCGNYSYLVHSAVAGPDYGTWIGQ
jgi:hypothetical protein